MSTARHKAALIAGGAFAGYFTSNFLRWLSGAVLARWLSDTQRRLELIPVVDDANLWSELSKLGCKATGMYAFYSSVVGGITTLPGTVGFGDAAISASVGLPVDTIDTGACVGCTSV